MNCDIMLFSGNAALVLSLIIFLVLIKLGGPFSTNPRIVLFEKFTYIFAAIAFCFWAYSQAVCGAAGSVASMLGPIIVALTVPFLIIR